LGEYSQCGSNAIGTSSTFSFLMCKLENKIQNMGKFTKVWMACPGKGRRHQNHNIEKINRFKQALHNKKLHKNSCCRILCKMYFKYLIMYH
jgi:hypothetical protein